MIINIPATGTTQATANPLQSRGPVTAFNVYPVPPNSGVILQKYVQGTVVALVQNSDSSSLNVYPLPGGTINGSSNAFVIASQKSAQFWALSDIDWITFTSAVSAGGYIAIPNMFVPNSVVTNGGYFSGPPSSGPTTSNRVFAWGLTGTLSVANDVSASWPTASKNGTYTNWYLVAKTGPVGASLVVDIKKSSDYGSTWTSLWASNPSNRPTIAAGSNNGNGTSFDTTSFSAGDIHRVDIIQVGSSTAGSNATLTLLGAM